MAPSIANFHHVEIDNIGKRRRNLYPPGGVSSDIFNFQKQVVVTQPRKVKFYNRSSIFTRESPPPPSTASKVPVLSIKPKLNTKQRLFGPPDEIRRKAIDRMKSSIFSDDPEPELKAKQIVKPDRRNPITGEECTVVQHMKRHQIEKRKSNPITGEGYQSPDEDDSTVGSISSNTSSRSETPFKGPPSAQANNLSDSSCFKGRSSAQSSSLKSHSCGKEGTSSQPRSPGSHTDDKKISTRPRSPRSNNDRENDRMAAEPNKASLVVLSDSV